MRYGVIDCGTNTFNMLVADIDGDGKWRRVFANSIPVKLAPSANTGNIGNNRFARGIDALFVHKNNIINLQVDQFSVVATSGIRESGNGREFVETAKRDLGMEIEIIDGKREAELIYKGVVSSGALADGPAIIMDIGGGSVEFILGNDQNPLWDASYLLGVSRLKGSYRPSNPMTKDEEHAIRERIRMDLENVAEKSREFGIRKLIGCSGSFDSIVEMNHAANGEKIPEDPVKSINIADYKILSEKLRNTTFEERLTFPGLIAMRADMIILSCLLINEVLEICNITELVQTDYALKEGLMHEMASVNAWNEN